MNDTTHSTASDSLRFRLTTARIVPRSSVRISVQVIALVDARDTDQAALDRRVLATLARFIDAKWTISALSRARDSSGYERVAIDAATRVPPAQNYDLHERAHQAGSPGLAIQSINVDYALETQVLVAETERLQEELVKVAQRRAQRFTELTGRDWRIGDIEFGVQDDESANYSRKGMARERAIENDELGLGMAERLVLLAEVTLRAQVPA